MTTFYLRFPDEDTYLQACQDAGFWITEDPPRLLRCSHAHILDVIGTITEGGEWDPETGEVITPPTVLDGFHVNAKLQELPAGWDAYLVIPTNPVRMFAGD